MRTQKMKTENENKRTKRKEIQFSEAEYAVIEKKANTARLSVAAFIREAALGKELSAALTVEESERMKLTANISYKMQVNLNQIARLANIHGLPFVTDAIREYICHTNEYFKTGTWREMDLSAYETEQKQREQLVAKIRELQEKNTELQKTTTNYYLYTAEGERLFCERHNCWIYPDNRGIHWHFKVADYPAYTLPAEISRAYLSHEISIRDVYVYWFNNEKKRSSI